LKEAR
jgi:hypothetical protein